jgi:hypothetical protein
MGLKIAIGPMTNSEIGDIVETTDVSMVSDPEDPEMVCEIVDVAKLPVDIVPGEERLVFQDFLRRRWVVLGERTSGGD